MRGHDIVKSHAYLPNAKQHLNKLDCHSSVGSDCYAPMSAEGPGIVRPLNYFLKIVASNDP